MAYSEDLRRKVIEYLEDGNTLESTHKVFKIGLTTIKEWKKQYKETGSLAKKELNRSFKKINPVKLSAYIKEHPGAYLCEIAEIFRCCPLFLILTPLFQPVFNFIDYKD